MKKLISTICILLLAGVYTIQAQTAEQPFGFKMFFGSQAYDGDLGNEITQYSDSDHTYGLGLSYYVNKYFDLSLEIKWMTLDKINPLNDTVFRKRGTSFSSENLNLNLLARFKPIETRLNPYIAAGLGLNFIEDVANARRDDSYTAFSIPFGLGVNYKLIDHIMVNVQALYNRTFTDKIDNYPLKSSEAASGVTARTDFDGKDHDDYFTLSAGIILTFGGEYKEDPDYLGELYKQSMKNLEAAENASDEAAATLDQAQQLNDETLAALDALREAIDQMPEQTEALKVELVRVVNNIQFEYDKAEIIEPAYEELNSLAAILQVYPGLSVDIAARADERGSNAYNDKLSMRRAQSVKDYLIGQGVSASRLKVVALGETDPLMDGNSPTAYAQNRSVQLTLHYTGNM